MKTESVNSGITDNPAMNRFEMKLDEDDVASIYYRSEEGRLVVVHTEVPFMFSGQGIASRLARAVLDELHKRGLKVASRCPFFSAYLAKHPEYSDLIDG